MAKVDQGKIQVPPTAVWVDFRGFEFMWQSCSLSIWYVSMLLGYYWHGALGLRPGNGAHDFWFPYGEQSLHYALVATLSDMAQDVLAHGILRKAAARHDNPCHFTRISPGWLRRPRRLGRVTMAAMSSLWAVAVLTQLGFVWKQRGLLDSRVAGRPLPPLPQAQLALQVQQHFFPLSPPISTSPVPPPPAAPLPAPPTVPVR